MIEISLVLPGWEWIWSIFSCSEAEAVDDWCLRWDKTSCVVEGSWETTAWDKWLASDFVVSLRLGTPEGPSRAIISSSSSITIGFWGVGTCGGVAFLIAINGRFWLTKSLALTHLPHCHVNLAVGLLSFCVLKALIMSMSSLSETGGEWHPGRSGTVSDLGDYKDKSADYDARN